MAKKPNISNVVQNATMVTTINNNFQNIQTAFENTVSRDGSIPNSMSGDLDMNNNDILNVGGLLVGGVDYLAGANAAKVSAEASAASATASAASASSSASAAAASASAAETAFDDFDDRYLGSKASAPSVDNDGDPLATGALYFDTTLGGMYVYNGSTWVAPVAGGTVTSVAQAVPTGFTVSGSPITASGTLTISYDTGYQGYTTAEATKLSGIETGADVTDTTNVTAAGALMDSELTSIASVKALNQGVATTDSPTFVTLNATTVDLGDWTITESAGVLYFKASGVNKMKIDASGNLTVTGDVTAYGTV